MSLIKSRHLIAALISYIMQLALKSVLTYLTFQKANINKL